MKPVITSFLLLWSCFISARAQIVQLHYSDDLKVPVIEVTANGERHHFIIDLGAEVTIINSQFIALSGSRKINAKDANNNAKEIVRSKLDSLVFGNNNELVLTDLDVYVAEMKENMFTCNAIAGILGMDILSRYIVEIDPEKKLFALHLPASGFMYKLDASFDQLPLSGGKRPVIVTAVNGQKLPFLLDTGSSGFIRISDKAGFEYDAALAQKISGYSAIGLNGRKDELINSNMVKGHMLVGNTSCNNISLLIEPTNSSKLGFQFLKQFHLYVAAGNKRVALKKTGDHIREDMLEKFGFAISVDQGNYVIARINLARQDLQVGDKVMAVNGIAPGNICALEKVKDDINRLAKQPVLTIERAGSIIVSTVSDIP